MSDTASLDGNYDELRYLVESTALIAMRDGVGIASKEGNSINYKDTMAFAERIAPFLFHRDRSLLNLSFESPFARECRAIANSNGISFIQAVKDQIDRYSNLLKNNPGQDKVYLRSRIDGFKDLLRENDERVFFEGKLIERDATIGYDLPISQRGDGYYDFGLPANRVMRIRVTHETKIEAINGTDLIYEHHDIRNGRARIVAVQYKIMEKGKYLEKYPGFRSQLERMRACFCERLPCINPNGDGQGFRFPSCTSFVRATNKVQTKNPRIMSIGYYIPVCKSISLWDNGRVLGEESLEGEVIRYRVFEEMFNSGLLGSDWIPYDQLESLYREHKILSPYESVNIHIQTYDDPYSFYRYRAT